MKLYVNSDCDAVRPEDRLIPVRNHLVEVREELGDELTEYDLYDELTDVSYTNLRSVAHRKDRTW
jgi:hypothetical protein